MKPGSFTQLYVQLVFAVKNRDTVLNKEIRYRVFEYISGIISEMGHKSIIVNGVSNHVHIFIGLNPSKSISDTVHYIKEVQHCSSTMRNCVPENFHGRRAMTDLLTAVPNWRLFTSIFKIRKYNIRKKHLRKSTFNF